MAARALLASIIGGALSATAPNVHSSILPVTQTCLEVLAAVPVGSVPSDTSFRPKRCVENGAAPAFRYDRVGRATRLARSLAPGEVVPVYPEFGVDRISPGQMLHIEIQVGPVRIEREVVALQSARRGQKLSVVTGDGEIATVRYGGGGR